MAWRPRVARKPKEGAPWLRGSNVNCLLGDDRGVRHGCKGANRDREGVGVIMRGDLNRPLVYFSRF